MNFMLVKAKGWPMNANENAKDNHLSHSSNTTQGISGKTTQDIFEETDPAVAGKVNKAVKSLAKNIVEEADELRPDKLKYMADMLVELRKIAENLDEKMVSYLIEMAILELHTVRSLSKFSGEISDKK